ncbi:MAG: type IX secretion system membrane protein PorP/SprF [Chitinophagales bacterium]
MRQPINIKIIATIILVSCCVLNTIAQQDAQYTQFMYNKLPQNAAYTGSKEGLSIRALYRDQWTSKKGNAIDGAPKTTSFSIHSPFKKESFALGFYFVNDRLGLEQKNQFDVTYAYRVSLGKKIKLSIGINAGLLWYKLNATEAILVNPDDPKYRNNVSRVLPDVGAGLYIYHPNFYIGLSVPNFIRGQLANKGDHSSTAKRTAHFVAMTGGLIPLGKSLKLRPQVQYCYLASAVQKVPHTFSFNLSLMIYDRVNIGAQYHTAFQTKNKETKTENPDSFDFMLEVWPTKHLLIGYSYDYTLSKLSTVSSGSHEIIVGYDFASRNKKKSTTNYSYF